MNKPTFKIDGPAGDKFTCSVPQQFHQIGNGVYDMKKLTHAQAAEIKAINPDFLIEIKTEQADAEKKANTKPQTK